MNFLKTKTEVNASWKSHDKKIQPYLWSHRVLELSSKLLSFSLFVSFIVSYRFIRWQDFLGEKGIPEILLWVFYFLGLAALWEVVLFPFSISHHWVERAHGLSKQSYSSWFFDRLKGYGVGGIIGVLAIIVIFWSLSASQDYWWLITGFLFIALSVVLAQLAPVVLIPLFFKLKPMESNSLKERLLKLSERFGVQVKDVYHLGMGEKTEKGNAAFVGIGKTKRILIGDTLYERFPEEEVEAVFAHELGHQVHQDLIKGICLSSLCLLATFWISNQVSEEWIFPTFRTDRNQPFGLLLFFVILSLVSIPFGVCQNAFSRWRERLADRFAQEHLKSGEALASALERLTFQNRGLFKPNALREFWSYSHPAPWRRINWLKRASQI